MIIMSTSPCLLLVDICFCQHHHRWNIVNIVILLDSHSFNLNVDQQIIFSLPSLPNAEVRTHR